MRVSQHNFGDDRHHFVYVVRSTTEVTLKVRTSFFDGLILNEYRFITGKGYKLKLKYQLQMHCRRVILIMKIIVKFEEKLVCGLDQFLLGIKNTNHN